MRWLPPTDTNLPSAISHYRIEEELGRGGMGVVYRAYDDFLRRKVAIKLLTDSSISQAQRRTRVLTEARAAAALHHPAIATIYEVGEEGERIFIVMELVLGETLRRETAGRRLPAHEVASLGSQLAEVLWVAHSAGVVHGDIKPENIIVQADGRLKLLDFGLARQSMEETVSRLSTLPTAEGEKPLTGGTLPYMAPEQFRGMPASFRSDLFALGVILYELLAGHLPFPGPSGSQFMAQILHEPEPPLTRDSQVPLRLAEIIHRVLEKESARRPASARELDLELRSFTGYLDEAAPASASPSGKQALAVLPFRLLTPNREDEYLSVALAESLVNALGSSGRCLVRPISAALRYSGRDADPLLAARELNVQRLVEGSVQKSGTRLRVHVNVLDGQTGGSVFSTKFDAESADLFGLQDSMAGAVARALGLRASEGRSTNNAQAYELYLRAVERLSRLNRWDTRTAIEMLHSATELDPKFSEAWARLATAQWLMGTTLDPGPKWLRQAEQASRRALSLDRGNAAAHCAKGLILWTAAKGFQNAASLRSLNLALTHSPGSLQALNWKGCIFAHLGLLQPARELLLQALAGNPEDSFTLTFLGQTAGYQESYEEATEWFEKALRGDPNSVWANLFAPSSLLYAGKLQRAEERLRISRSVIGNDPLQLSHEALLWAKRGERRKTEQLVSKALRSKKQLAHSHHCWHAAAAALALIGKPVPALALLKKCAAMGLPNYPVFRDEDHFASLHQNPQFLRLVADLKKKWTSYQREFC